MAGGDGRTAMGTYLVHCTVHSGFGGKFYATGISLQFKKLIYK